MKIKNAKGQYYAVKCETLEESNKVFSLCGYNTIPNYYRYATTDNGCVDCIDEIINTHELIKFKDWVKLGNEPIMITIPIEDYNRLRKLEIKEQIRKLKKEYDTL